jgi:hypothetical protein
MYSLLLGVGGIWVIIVGLWAKSLSVATYGGLMVGFGLGTIVGSKEN